MVAGALQAATVAGVGTTQSRSRVPALGEWLVADSVPRFFTQPAQSKNARNRRWFLEERDGNMSNVSSISDEQRVPQTVSFWPKKVANTFRLGDVI